MSAADTTMPWGKHRGCRLAEIPSAYLCWCLDETSIHGFYRDAIREVLAERLQLRPPVAAGPTPPRDLAPVVHDLIVAGFRALAMKQHPDRGGAHEAMQRLNAARAWCHAQRLL